MKERSRTIMVNQIEFSSVLFDTLFGLVLYFSLDSFLEISSIIHFIFYLFTSFILVHWWLLFKTADDSYGTEVTSSALDIIIGIAEIIFLEFIILFAQQAEYRMSLLFMLMLLFVDIVWGILWRFVGKWRTSDKVKIKQMENELESTITSDLAAFVGFITIFMLMFLLPNTYTVLLTIICYIFYIFLTFKTKVIDIKIF